MKHSIRIIVILFIAIWLSGCVDELGAIDLSGEYPLHSSNDGWAYRIIGDVSLNRYNLEPNSRMIDYRNYLEQDTTFRIAGTDYLFVSRFQGGYFAFGRRNPYIEAYRNFQTQVYNYNTHEPVKPFVIQQSDTGDDWDSRLDPGGKDIKQTLSRSGNFKFTFYDEGINQDLIVYSSYSIDTTAERKVNKQDQYILDKNGYYQYDDVKAVGWSQICIGTRRCLIAEHTVGSRKIILYVLDWDFDGKFTAADRIYCNYTDDFYWFGNTIRLSESFNPKKDNKYILSLVAPANPNDLPKLKIELVEKGIREK